MDSASYEIRNKNLRLVKVSKQNFWALMDLRVAKEQENFVASNAVSLAQAYDTIADGRFVQCFGIYDGQLPVGFAMIGHNSEEYEGMADVYRHSYCLWRFMIDQRYQKRGYGRDALMLLLDYIRTFPDGEESLWSTSYEPENEVAAKLYRDFGFAENGEKDGDEIVAVLKL
ncbi:MAG: GNAT family N-acetyltransferase [Oscillospiraceae bacterium]|nr:GNAT family N-acetyltransferase [Oscillospiraceae bacterium]